MESSTSPSTKPLSMTPKRRGTKVLRPLTLMKVDNLESPHELTAYVEGLLGQVESHFDALSDQLLGRLNDLITRADSIENGINEILRDNAPSLPATPTRRDTGPPSTPATPSRITRPPRSARRETWSAEEKRIPPVRAASSASSASSSSLSSIASSSP